MTSPHSMTGFAARTGAAGPLSWTLDIRAVNARGLDLRFRLPERLMSLEPQMRARLQKRFHRGGISVALRLERAEGGASIHLDEKLVEAYIEAAIRVRTIAKNMGLKLPPSEAADFLTLRGVIGAGDDLDGELPEAQIMSDFDAMLDEFAANRAAEGAALAGMLEERLEAIATLTTRAADLAEARRESQKGRLTEQLARILDDVASADPDRVAQELALLAVKSDVSEEIDRLGAHVSAARGHLASGGAIGRKLDFLMQEFNREANTLCSKAGSTELTQLGLELKHLIDQMREQVQNVE